jgi:hypothetical protein
MGEQAELRLSLNELRALLRRGYEALYHHGYDFAVMARSCLWLEAHGLDGIGLILRSLPDLETPCRDIVLTEPETGHFHIDGRGRCLIPFVNASADLAIAAAQKDGFGQVDIVNIFGRLNIFATLKKAAYLNLYAAAIWYDGTEGRTHVMWLKSSRTLPDYFIMDKAVDGPWGRSGLRYVCATNPERVEKNVMAVLSEDIAPFKTASQLAEAYEMALDEGIIVSSDAYKTLNKIADRLLVPSTDESRRGAGE